MRLALATLLLWSHFAWGEVRRSVAEQCVRHYADRYGVPPELIEALIDVESGWNSRAVSSKGAMGLMQLMPHTARRFGSFHPFEVEENIAAGTRYVTVLMWEFHGDLRLVVAAYYAGDRWVNQRRLDYRNAGVVAYVRAVRWRYQVRKIAR